VHSVIPNNCKKR